MTNTTMPLLESEPDMPALLSANTGQDWSSALILFVAIFLGIFVTKKLLYYYYMHWVPKMRRHHPHKKVTYHKLIAVFVDVMRWPLMLVLSLYAAAQGLETPPFTSGVLYYLFLITILVYASKGLIAVASFVIQKKTEDHDEAVSSFSSFLQGFSRVVIVLAAVLFFLSNVGLNITGLVAGLGIGGVVIAFAFQNILEDIFSSLSIFFDKPFKEGDFIIVGDDMGTVERVGIKTTRIRALEGQQLIMTNKELTNSRINNQKEMRQRRVTFTFGVAYETSMTKLKRIPDIITDIIAAAEKAKLERVHFKEFGEYSLVFEVVYYVRSKDYGVYMDVQEQINFALMRELRKRNISFAYPTQQIYTQRSRVR